LYQKNMYTLQHSTVHLLSLMYMNYVLENTLNVNN